MRALSLILIALLITGCNDTWSGMKKDSSEVWSTTKTKANNVGRAIVE